MKTDKVTIIASSGIQLREYRNLALIPAFYFLPKYDLDLFDPWVFQIPRNPHRIINNPKALELIESDRFVAMLQYMTAGNVCSAAGKEDNNAVEEEN